MGQTEKIESGNVGMKKLIPIVNKLQDVCAQMGATLQFDLPQIAVIGSQSAGKSSVLENIVGKDFLPRGSGIVTRRPLILQLIHGEEEYGEFSHCKDDSNQLKKFSDFDEIRAEIEDETDRETGSNKGISNKPITLRLYSPKVLDLTLIDLPGITKVPVGDQPADIETQIRQMILEFITKENCLILAVSPANCDLANSDALKLAKEVDPEGLRTIGVITKLDLMDEGTDARDIFEGRLLPLPRYGYIGVVNRSQKDIDNKKNISATLEAEREFFSKHSYYHRIVNRLGTPYLQKTLSKELDHHIRKTMRGLQDETRNQMNSLKKEIANYETLHPSDPTSTKTVMIEVIQHFQSDFKKEMGSLGSDDVYTNQLSCGAKIRRIFHERLPQEVKNVQYNKDELRQKIAIAIDNMYGINGVLNTPFKVFEALVKKQICDLEEPIEKCIELVIEELKNAVRRCTQRIASYPKFQNYVEKDIISFIDTNLQSKTLDIVKLVQMESAYMNSQHYEFKNKHNKMEALVEKLPIKLTSSQKKELVSKLEKCIVEFKDDQEIDDENVVIQLKNDTDKTNDLGPLEEDVDKTYDEISSYMNIVKKTMFDMVPKAITLYVIRNLEKFIKTDLLVKVTGVLSDENLFGADEEEIEKYKSMKKLHETSKKALEIMNSC